jgi:hypothetical protein
MTITAKFPGTCHRCSGRITPGQQIEWTRGTKPTHTTCGAPTTTATSSRSRSCVACGHVEVHGRYPDPDRILRSGECRSCYEERKMGY